jgi:hypothetical protein
VNTRNRPIIVSDTGRTTLEQVSVEKEMTEQTLAANRLVLPARPPAARKIIPMMKKTFLKIEQPWARVIQRW